MGEKKKKLLLGMTGTIASLNIFHYLNVFKESYDIKIIMTRAATKFINPNGLRPLVESVHTSLFDMKDIRVPHVNLLEDIDKFLILPTTANFLAKIANGMADDLLSACVLNYNKPIFLAPNMNPTMWSKSSVQRNVKILKEDGFIFLNKTASGLEASSGKRVVSDAALPSANSILYSLFKDEESRNSLSLQFES
ncbi:flavoprotein [Niallia sp.]|uniref:flavoprotein n=1 Tax=Niallia sp. TaxID=2837523 RepID=UPI002897E62D|nr:flavoprotein [Niallia sp.]